MSLQRRIRIFTNIGELALHRSDYLNDVSPFIDWLTTTVYNNSDEILHEWTSSGHRTIGIPKGEKWCCSSLWDAYNKYYWGSLDPNEPTNHPKHRITSISDTEHCLERLSDQLKSNLSGDETINLSSTCEKVLIWGGVGRNKHIASHLRYSLTCEEDRRSYLNACANLLTSEMKELTGIGEISIGGIAHPVQIDSGTTKIFSLIVPNFIIYDSRVGAALGILIAKWARVKNISEIPGALHFPWGSGSKTTNRNANELLSSHKPVFPRMPRGSARLGFNIKASWICEQLAANIASLSTDKFSLMPTPKRIRAIEAALFMLGYSIN